MRRFVFTTLLFTAGLSVLAQDPIDLIEPATKASVPSESTLPISNAPPVAPREVSLPGRVKTWNSSADIILTGAPVDWNIKLRYKGLWEDVSLIPLSYDAFQRISTVGILNTVGEATGRLLYAYGIEGALIRVDQYDLDNKNVLATYVFDFNTAVDIRETEALYDPAPREVFFLEPDVFYQLFEDPRINASKKNPNALFLPSSPVGKSKQVRD